MKTQNNVGTPGCTRHRGCASGTSRLHRLMLATGVGLLAAFGALAADPAATPAPAPVPLKPGAPRTFVAHEAMVPAGKVQTLVPEEQRHLFKVVDDEQTTGGKALEVKVDKRMILAERDRLKGPKWLPILRLPGLPRAEAPVGLYRITARVKLDGMLNVIGTGIAFRVDGTTASPTPGCTGINLHGFMFRDNDSYQEFSFVTEVVEADAATGRLIRPAAEGALGAYPGTQAEIEKRRKFPKGTPEEQAKRAEQDAKNQESWKSQFANGRMVVEMAYNEAPPLGFGRIYNTIQAVRVDWIRVERLAADTAPVVRQVLPQKVWLRPGDEQQFHVWMHNRTGAAQDAVLRVEVVHGLNERIAVAEKPVRLEAGKYQVIDIPWKTVAGRDLWGCEVRAALVQGGQVRSEAGEMFSVHKNPWAVMNFGGATPTSSPYYRPIDYRNYMEYFGVAPGDTGKPFPDNPDEPYFTGMSNYMTQVDLQKRMTDHNREIGVATFMYLSPLVTGLYAEELYLKHPEWFFSRLSWTDQSTDQWKKNTEDMLTRWRAGRAPPTRDEGFWQFFHIEAGINGAFPEVADMLIDGIRKNMRYVGYDGVRWDGGPLVVNSAERYGVKAGPGNHEADMKDCAEKIRRIKREVRAEFPLYTEGNNGTPYGEAGSMYKRTAPPSKLEELPCFTAFLDDGSSLMDEGWMSAYGWMDPRNIIKDYFWGARRETHYCRLAGGFLHTFSPERDGAPYFTISTIYYNLLVALAGAQYPGMFSCTPGSDTGTTQFLTRFSEFLWDNKLMWVENAKDLIRVDAPVDLWYDETVVARDLPDGRRRFVIPLVNPPPNERFYTDRFSELPEPVRAPFPVEIQVPAGFTKAVVTMLTAEPRTAAVPLKSEIAGGTLRFEVPSLTIFRVLVVEFAK